MSLNGMMCDTVTTFRRSSMPTLMGGAIDVYLVDQEEIKCNIQQAGSSPDSSNKDRGLSNSYSIYFNYDPCINEDQIIKIIQWAGQRESWDGTQVTNSKITRVLEVTGVNIRRGRSLCVYEVSAIESTTQRIFATTSVIKLLDDGSMMLADDGSLIIYESTN